MIRKTVIQRSLISAVLVIASFVAAHAASQTVEQAYPRLTSGALKSARLTALPAGTILRAGDVQITQKDLDSEIAKSPAEIRDQLKTNAFFLLENKATKELMLAEAKAWAKKSNRRADEPEDQLMQAYFKNLVEKVDFAIDEDAKSFYDANKEMLGSATFEQVKDQIKEYLLDQKRQETIDAHIKTIGNRTLIEVDKSWTAKQYVSAMNNPVDKARKSGKPSVVDFGADGCKPCDMMTPILDALKKEYEGKVNVLFVHVRKEQILAARYGIQSIPVQIFFDNDGKEVFRHVGFFPKQQIVAKLAEMGVK